MLGANLGLLLYGDVSVTVKNRFRPRSPGQKWFWAEESWNPNTWYQKVFNTIYILLPLVANDTNGDGDHIALNVIWRSVVLLIKS